MAGYKKSIVLGLDIDEFKANAKKAQDAIEDIGDSSQGLESDLEGAAGSSDLFATGLNAVVDVAELFKTGLSVAGEVLGALVDEMKDCIDTGAEYASQMSDLASANNWTTEQAQAWSYLANQTGTAIDSLTGGFSELQIAMDKANRGNKETILAFSELGVSFKDSNGKLRDSQSVFVDVVDKLNNMQDATKKTKLGNDLLGNSYSSLNSVISKGAAGIKDAMQSMKGFLSEDEIKALNEYNEALAIFQQNIDLVKSHLGAAIAEAITPFIEVLNELDPSAVADGIMDFGEAVKDAGETLVPFIGYLHNIREAFKTLKELIPDIKSGFEQLKGNSLGDIAKWVVTGNNSYIGHNANGSERWRGGLTWVGEEGPELVNLPSGSTIYNNQQSNNVAGNTTYNITMNCDLSELRSVSDVIDAVSNLNNSRRGFA